jgi:DNA-binding transcriptional MerR regulator
MVPAERLEARGAMMERMLKTHEVSNATGASLRQLQWWDERGILKADVVEGHARLYSAETVARAKRLTQLRRAGASLQQIRRLKLLSLDFDTVVRVSRTTLIGATMFVPGERKRSR